jgi:hypothetical protein
MKYFLGMDVGSSKTHALIVDETGRCVGFGSAGGGNHQSSGYDGFERVVLQSFGAASQMSGVDQGQIIGAGFGVAGYDFPSDREMHLRAISSLRLSCPVEVVNDGMIGLLAGATRGIGVNVTAGSSNNCRGKNKAGREGRIVRRTGNAGQQTHNDHQRIEHIELTHQTKSQGAEGAKDQPKQDQFFASKFVGQRTAEGAADQTKERRHSEQDACLRHAHVEPLCNVEGKEGEEERASDPVDEAYTDYNPEKSRKLTVDFIKTSEHFHPFVRGR